MLIYDVDKIENLYQDFEKVKKNFINKEYDDFRTSYFFNCNDSVIVKLRNRIQNIYDNIKKGYDMIDKVWKEYVEDVGNFDKSIASSGNCGIHDGGVSSIVSRICSLDLYESAGVSNSFKSIVASSHVSDSFAFKITNFLKRAGASILNTAFSLISGVAQFVEAIVDCAVLVVGIVIGLRVIAFDGITSLLSKDKDGFGITKKYFNSLLKIVGYDAMGTLKNKFYESSKFGKWLDENSYSPFKSDGIVYKIGEGIGYVAGVVVLTVITFGSGGVLTSITSSAQIGSGIIAGTAAVGKTAQSGYNSTVDKVVEEAAKNGVVLDRNNVELDGKQMAGIIGNSVVQGGIEGVTFALTYGKGIKADKIFGESLKKTNEIAIKGAIQFGKEYAKAGSDELFNIKDHTAGEVFKNAVTAASVSVIYDKIGIGNKVLQNTSDKITNVSFEATEKALTAAQKAATEEITEKVANTTSMLISEGLETVDDSVLNSSVYKEVFNNATTAGRKMLSETNPNLYGYLYDGTSKVVRKGITDSMIKLEKNVIDKGLEILDVA